MASKVGESLVLWLEIHDNPINIANTVLEIKLAYYGEGKISKTHAKEKNLDPLLGVIIVETYRCSSTIIPKQLTSPPMIIFLNFSHIF